jgi:ADP-ribose pyrophosphatase YjhB (NUDIX family)
MKRNAHCSYCGAGFDGPWPRTCRGCGQISYLNPIPVVVLVVPIDDGVLVVRRGIPPQKGKLALPGGFVNWGESWEAAGAREVFEETGLRIEASEVKLFQAHSTPDGALVLLFGAVEKRRPRSAIPAFVPNDEVTELTVLDAPCELAFDLHTKVLRDWFKAR